MSWVLMTIVVLLIAVAIGVQVYYVRGMRTAGVELNRATRIVVYVNIGLLAMLALGLAGFVAFGGALAGGM